ncbi:MAG: hypothetical protein M3Q95_08850 [Bacteroidota bacterium]|nr:hypothetical protein [Bacteroidota bacterium]
MIIITLSFLRVRGMAIYPFILLKHKTARADKVLINHERIHLRQQLELLFLPFYLFYFINYLYNLITTFDHQTAYRNIIFEQEAYDHEQDGEYLKKRRLFGFLDYL